MLIVMHKNATEENVQAVCEKIEKMGFTAHPMPGAQTLAICVTNNPGAIESHHFSSMAGVAETIRVSKSYKLASIETKPEPTIININGHNIGKDFTIMAGPCSVETLENTMRIAKKLAKRGVKFFRAGAYKPRTGPYSFQGLGVEGLKILAEVKKETGMAIVTEVMDAESLPEISKVADILQVGTRNMQNYSLLTALGKQRIPVLLKRGMSATLEELVLAAEYILAGGNYKVILCERGIRTYGKHSRNTLDVAAIPALRKMTHLPIIVDPSHAAGLTYMVPSLAYAGTAVGADGLIIEAHDDAENAYSDGQQVITPETLSKVMADCEKIRDIVTH